MPSVYTASDEVLNPCSWFLPRLPNAHSQTTAKPFVYLYDLIDHIAILEIFRPASQVVPQGCLALLITHAVTSRSNLLEFAAQLGLASLM